MLILIINQIHQGFEMSKDRIKTIKPSREVESIVLDLEKLKYEIGHTSPQMGESLEYEILVKLRSLHSYLIETSQ